MRAAMWASTSVFTQRIPFLLHDVELVFARSGASNKVDDGAQTKQALSEECQCVRPNVRCAMWNGLLPDEICKRLISCGDGHDGALLGVVVVVEKNGR